jgi:hypothetical protein
VPHVGQAPPVANPTYPASRRCALQPKSGLQTRSSTRPWVKVTQGFILTLRRLHESSWSAATQQTPREETGATIFRTTMSAQICSLLC